MSFWTAVVVIVAIIAGSIVSISKQKQQRSNKHNDANTEALEKELAALQARVQTLEKIVTDPSYDLKQEFKQL